MLTDFNLSVEPAWPWSTIGVTAAALALLTVWTYLGVKHAWRRVAVVLALRLGALALAFMMLMRPSFAMTYIDGIEPAKWLVVFDASESMNVADVDGKPTRWEHVNKLWESPEVKRRLERLASDQQIEVVKYHAAEELRPYDTNANATGKRTDIGMWLHQLWLKHAHEKHLRGIAVFSDGADTGGAFLATDKAKQWRPITPIHALGVGDPNNPKLKKDIGLTSIRVADEKPLSVKAKFNVMVVAQAPGFSAVDVKVRVVMEEVNSREKKHKAELKPDFRITQAKDQQLTVECIAPELPGEYKLTLTIEPHPEEANKENNSISTFVHVMKEKLNILWVDRLRVYEPTFAIRTLAAEPNLSVRHVVVPKEAKGKPAELYEFAERHYDVIIIGDISAEQFSQGDKNFFAEISKLVREKKTGLLMLGGTKTFAPGGWRDHAALMDLLPVAFDAAKPAFQVEQVRAAPVKGATNFAFLDLLPDPKANEKLWQEDFDPLQGFAPLGALANKGTALLERDKDTPLLAVTRAGEGRTAVFAGDSTHKAWIQRTADAEGNLTRNTSAAYKLFWKSLVLWLAWQKDQGNQLWIALDQRRINVDANETLGFKFGLRDKDGRLMSNAQFEGKVIGPNDAPHAIRFGPEQDHQRGSFQATKEPGEYQLVIKGTAPDVSAEETARFLVTSEDIEKLRPLAEHDKLKAIAAASDGRFQPATEAALLQLLDELKNQAASEGRQKIAHWPDWKRLPASDQVRDQVPGMWHSFAFVGFVLFVGLLACEWLLRRRWELA